MAISLLKMLQQEGLGHCLKQEQTLTSYTTFGVGGIAEIMAFPSKEEEFSKIFKVCHIYNITPRLLGGGSNLMVLSEKIPLVISTEKWQGMHFDENYIDVKSGTKLPLLVRKSVFKGLSGLETLVGIPGSVGGAIAGNSGSKPEGEPAEIGSFVEKVRVVKSDGSIHTLNKEQISFEYRNSNLRSFLVLSAVLKVGNYTDKDVLIKRWQNFFRKKSQAQPFSSKSAGCVFKNPSDKPAWKVIYEAGLSGFKLGKVQISPKHANFMVNLGDACIQEVRDMLHVVCERTRCVSGVDLKMEVKVW